MTAIKPVMPHPVLRPGAVSFISDGTLRRRPLRLLPPQPRLPRPLQLPPRVINGALTGFPSRGFFAGFGDCVPFLSLRAFRCEDELNASSQHEVLWNALSSSKCSPRRLTNAASTCLFTDGILGIQ